jgi:hypothetical protein
MVLPYQYNKVLGQVLRALWISNLWGKWVLQIETDDIDAMTSALLNAHAQSVISINKEDDVATVGTNFSGAGSSAFEAFDNVLTRRIQKVVLGQTLTSGTDGVEVELWVRCIMMFA